MFPSISLHSASVPIFIQQLRNLSACLDKAEAYAAVRKFDPAVLLAARLAPDMLPLVKQVQIACDSSKFAVGRLAGIDAPKFDDTEASLADLKARIAKTVEFLGTVTAEQLNGHEGRDIEVPMRGAEPMKFKGEQYLKHWAMPNFFFHVTVAYALLRHNGVELGKRDFLGLR